MPVTKDNTKYLHAHETFSVETNFSRERDFVILRAKRIKVNHEFVKFVSLFVLIYIIYIYEVKIVAQACIQKISELQTGIEPVSPDCRFGCFTTRL